MSADVGGEFFGLGYAFESEREDICASGGVEGVACHR